MNENEWKTVQKKKSGRLPRPKNQLKDFHQGKCTINSCNKNVLFNHLMCFSHYFEFYPNPDYKKRAYKLLTECQGGCGKLNDDCTCTETDLFKGSKFKGWENYYDKMVEQPLVCECCM